MIGMNAITGKAIEGLAHLRQSIADILTTPIGSRVMRRDYGSLLPELIDQPLNGATVVQVYAATAIALMRWEPRLRLHRVQLSSSAAGAASIEIEGTRTDIASNERTRITIPLRASAG